MGDGKINPSSPMHFNEWPAGGRSQPGTGACAPAEGGGRVFETPRLVVVLGWPLGGPSFIPGGVLGRHGGPGAPACSPRAARPSCPHKLTAGGPSTKAGDGSGDSVSLSLNRGFLAVSPVPAGVAALAVIPGVLCAWASPRIRGAGCSAHWVHGCRGAHPPVGENETTGLCRVQEGRCQRGLGRG